MYEQFRNMTDPKPEATIEETKANWYENDNDREEFEIKEFNVIS